MCGADKLDWRDVVVLLAAMAVSFTAVLTGQP